MPIVWVLKQYSFWLELVIMVVCPLPFKFGGEFLHERVVTVGSINWVENGSVNNAQSVIYDTPYFMTDFYLAFMFLRCYFLALAVIMYSPVNERLYGKRICQNAGFEPSFSFQIKAGMRSAPIATFCLMQAILIVCLSYVIRIFERPYFAFNFID